MEIAPEDVATTLRGARRVRWGWVVAACLWGAWLVGQLARDRVWLTGLGFYIPSENPSAPPV